MGHPTFFVCRIFCGERFDCNQVSVAIYSLMIILLLNLCADCSIVFFMIGNYVH